MLSLAPSLAIKVTMADLLASIIRYPFIVVKEVVRLCLVGPKLEGSRVSVHSYV